MLFYRMRSLFGDRAGLDPYGACLLGLCFVLQMLGRLFGLIPLMILGFAVLGYAVFRIFSRRPVLRQQENLRFMGLLQSAGRFFRSCRVLCFDKDHRYFRCPNCHQPLRVPRDKGKLRITCRMCGAQFDKKT